MRHRVGLPGGNQLLHVLRLRKPHATRARRPRALLHSDGRSAVAGRRATRRVQGMSRRLRGLPAPRRDVQLQSDPRGSQPLRVGPAAHAFTVHERPPVRESIRRSKHALLRARRQLLRRPASPTGRVRPRRRLPDRRSPRTLRLRAVRPLRNAGVRARVPHRRRLFEWRTMRGGPPLRAETVRFRSMRLRPPLLERHLPAQDVLDESRLRRILRERFLLRGARSLPGRERAQMGGSNSALKTQRNREFARTAPRRECFSYPSRT